MIPFSLRSAHLFSWCLFVFILASSLIYIYTFPLEGDERGFREGPIDIAFAQSPLSPKGPLPSYIVEEELPLVRAVDLSVLAPSEGITTTSFEPFFIVDDFETSEATNRLGSRANVYVKAPSQIMVSQGLGFGAAGRSLMLRYAKKNSGGPYGKGGWCGYYSLMRKDQVDIAGGEPVYFDAQKYSHLTFWVRGERGGENFMVGLADSQWDSRGDSLKSQEIGNYLENGKVTRNWQRVMIPLSEFFLDRSRLASITIAFEADCFPDGAGFGEIYLDDLGFN
jgi:hypothetical protein